MITAKLYFEELHQLSDLQFTMVGSLYIPSKIVMF